MKHFLIAGLIACTICLFISCTKKSITPGSPAIILDASNDTIFGKWNLVTDSASVDVGFNNHLIAYTGKAGDYFDFRADNHVYIKEDTVLDTLIYTPLKDSTIIISSFGITGNGIPDTTHIYGLSASHAILYAPEVITPGGAFYRKVELKR